MSPSALLRPPLVWLIVAEAAMIVVLVVVTWHVWQQRVAPLAAPSEVYATPPRAARVSPAPAPSSWPPGAQPAVRPTPGIDTSAGFLAREMAELNRVEAAFEDLEWRVTSALADAIQRYITGVVLPTIVRAEGGQR